MSKNAKIAVLGDPDSIMIFKALGFHTIYVKQMDEINHAIHKLAGEDYAIIFITENVAALAKDTIDIYKTVPFPAIIPIPSRFGLEGFGMQGVKDNIEKAVGADIL